MLYKKPQPEFPPHQRVAVSLRHLPVSIGHSWSSSLVSGKSQMTRRPADCSAKRNEGVNQSFSAGGGEKDKTRKEKRRRGVSYLVLVISSTVLTHGRFGELIWQLLQGNASLFECCFPYVCPEPVLVK